MQDIQASYILWIPLDQTHSVNLPLICVIYIRYIYFVLFIYLFFLFQVCHSFRSPDRLLARFYLEDNRCRGKDVGGRVFMFNLDTFQIV